MGELLDILARVEGLSPRLRSLTKEPRQLLLARDRAVDAELEHRSVPFRVDPRVWRRAPRGPAVRADAVLMSSIPTRRVGLRAFYLDAELTLAVHDAPLARRSPLLHGSRVADRLRVPAGGVAIPAQLERARRLRLAWVIEELLVGQRIGRADWPQAVDDVVDGVAALWRRASPDRVPVRRVVPWLSSRRVSELLEAMEVLPERPDRFASAVDRLATERRPMLIGWTHGDPVPNNVLRLGDGRPGLVDWERAGRNPLGLDLGRALTPLADPDAAIARVERMAGRLGAARTLPLSLQAAVTLIGLMPTWAAQRGAWQAAGRATGYAVRNRRRVALLERLLDP